MLAFHFPRVTRQASEFFMFPVQHILCLGVMVEHPYCPTVRVMTGRAIDTQLAFVLVVFAMTVDAGTLRGLVDLIEMAVFARHHCVETE